MASHAPSSPQPTASTSGEPAPTGGGEMSPAQFGALREAFWHNVVREMLAGLMLAGQKQPELLDGRFALLTHGGERIPIGDVEPIFGWTVRDTQAQQELSAAVQMTVFRITTPGGEVFTLPVHEVRAFQEFTPELLKKLQQAEAEADRAAGDTAPRESRPFGFAAFAALPKLPPTPAPTEPTE